MHIPDSMLPAQVCAAGYGLTGLMTWYSLRQIDRQGNPGPQIPKAALLSAAFFVGSAIAIPIFPFITIHFVLNGLLGVLLGYFAFPAILIGLFLQVLMMGHGGFTTIGVNAVMMGIPALLAHRVFQMRHLLKQPNSRLSVGGFAFLGGAIGFLLTLFIFVGLTITTIQSGFDTKLEQTAIITLMLAHLPLVLLESGFTAMLAVFLQRVKPELLTGI
ncbi:MAG: cobalt transporter CbiM [Cyanobacteria bacterium J06560_2]